MYHYCNFFSEELWKANSYVSSCVKFDSDDDEDSEDEESSGLRLDEEEDDDKGKTSRAIHYVSGDVTHPVQSNACVNLIIHCTGNLSLSHDLNNMIVLSHLSQRLF